MLRVAGAFVVIELLIIACAARAFWRLYRD